jgi:hypothetical protein
MRNPSTQSRSVHPERGQVLALSCVLLLVMALTMILSFNLAQGIHEKIRIQSESDAVAYSLAAVEARSFNYLAYTNRTVAAGLVAQMGLHAWMSTASAAVATLEAGGSTFLVMFVIEFVAAGFCPYPPFICCIQPQHCPHAFEALFVAFRMFSEAQSVAGKVQNLDSKFNDGVDDLKKMVDQMHKDQRNVLDVANNTLKAVPGRLKDLNAPKSTNAFALEDTNHRQFACALEGSNFDDDCTTRSKASAKVRSVVLENSANASRNVYHRLLATQVDANNDFQSNSNYLKGFQDQAESHGGTVMVGRGGNAHVGEGDNMGSSSSDAVQSVGASQMVLYSTTPWHEFPMGMVSWAKVFSDSNGGTHAMGFFSRSDSNHSKFKGAQNNDVCGDDENCFIHFRASSKADEDFGQPSAYGGVEQDLKLRVNDDKSPWSLNDAGTVTLELSRGDPARLELGARRNGVAVSKAKAYFHQPANWKAPPNFFDPFWRAKLHPFKRQELQNVLSSMNKADDSALAGELPYEGDTR